MERQYGLAATYGAIPLHARARDVPVGFRTEVRITRFYSGRGKAFDDDNMVAACKGLRDGIADAFGMKDNDPLISFEYRQERSPVMPDIVPVTDQLYIQFRLTELP